MNEQFENELKRRINKEFENFEHPAVNKGWMRMREKLSGAGKNRGNNWLWALSVATVFLLILFGVNTLVNRQKDEAKGSDPKSIKHNDRGNASKSQNKLHNDTVSSLNYSTVTNNSKADTTLHINSKLTAKNLPEKNQTVSPKRDNSLAIKTHAINNNPSKTQIVRFNSQSFFSFRNKNGDVTKFQANNTTENLASTKNDDTPKTVDNEVTAVSSNNDTAAKAQSFVTVHKPFKKPDTVLVSEKHAFAKPQKTIEKNTNKIEFGIYAAAYFNHARGSNNQLNAGTGITADISLFKNLKLSTGLAIEQNILDYGNKLPDLNSVINTGATLAFNLQKQTFAANGGVVYSPVLKNYTARLLGLDVPLNLKYEFNSRKNISYLSMGLSSGAFIHQSYTYQYNYSSVSVQTIAISSNLSSLYFAKTLNVAFGLGYPIGKTNNLIIEPFLKYPLIGLGNEGIRFGAGGINLKFEFKSSKK